MDELAAHRRQIAHENRQARAWNTEEKFEEMIRLASIVESHVVSAREAAWRQDEALLRTHLGHAREALILALKVMRTGVEPR